MTLFTLPQPENSVLTGAFECGTKRLTVRISDPGPPEYMGYSEEKGT